MLAVTLAGCSGESPVGPRTGMGVVHQRAHQVITCSATGPGVSSCPDVSLTMDPYAPGAAFGDFQSGPGTGASSTITIVFSKPIMSVTVTVEDPTWAGNVVQAYNADGALVGTATVAFNNTPGQNDAQTVTLSGRGIRTLKLVPAANDYVAYSGLTFTPQGFCPTNDAALDNPAVRQALLAALTASGAFNNDPAARRENGGYIYQRVDGTYDVRTTTPSPTNAATPCSSTPGGPAPQAGETVIGPWHTHPFSDGDVLPSVPGCGTNRRETYAYDSDRYGGGSKADWEFIQTEYNGRLLPMFIIDKDEVFRLDAATPELERANNPNRFQWNSGACPW